MTGWWAEEESDQDPVLAMEETGRRGSGRSGWEDRDDEAMEGVPVQMGVSLVLEVRMGHRDTGNWHWDIFIFNVVKRRSRASVIVLGQKFGIYKTKNWGGL